MRFFDFADALPMEPLAALLMPINVLAHQLGASADDRCLATMTDAELGLHGDSVAYWLASILLDPPLGQVPS